MFFWQKIFFRILPLSLIPLFVSINTASAQEKETYIHLSATAYGADNQEEISFVTVVEKKSKTGTVSDEKGFFSIYARPYDTLLISAIGFTTYEYVVKYSEGKKLNEKFYLASKTYELEEVGVFAHKNFQEFKKDFINLNLPEEHKAYIPPPVMVYTGSSQPTATLSGPFTKLYDKYSKRGKQEKKVAFLRVNNEKLELAQERFNREFIVKILEVDDTEADSVLSHCKFSTEFINASTDYELVQALKECYFSYKKP